MANIKKAYQPIVELLEANSDKKVKSIMDQIVELCSAKTSRSGGGASSYIKNEAGEVVAILDYYFKRWMPLIGDAAVEFGAKKNTATGLNTMSKEGVSNWTKQQRVAKQANAELLTRVASGEIKPGDIADEQAKIEATRVTPVATELGFETREEVIAYLADNGVTVDGPAELAEAA